MKRTLFIFLGFILVVACHNSEEKSVKNDQYLVPKGRLKNIIDSFVDVAGNKNEVNEIFVSKEGPFEANIILYSGDRSLTWMENKIEGQRPLEKMLAMGVEFDLYSGIERFFNSPDSIPKKIPRSEIEEAYIQEPCVMWAVKDSAGILSVFPISSGYPFMAIPDPIPDSIMEKFKTPVVHSGE